MNRLATVAASSVRVTAQALGAVGSAVSRYTAMIFTSARGGWTVLLARTKFDYQREVGDPLSNSIVAAVVGWIMRNFPEAPVRIQRPDADGVMQPVRRGGSRSVGAEFLLYLLENPNPYYSGVVLWMATIVDYVATGNAYWFRDRRDDGLAGRVMGLWWLPSWMVEPTWDQDDPHAYVDSYDYKVDGGIWRVRREDIVHFRQGLDPRNPRKGLSRLGSLFREVFTDDEASNLTASLMRNLGVPGVIISPSNTAPNTKVDADKIKTSFKEKFGGDKAGEPMVITSPADIKQLSWSPSQMNLKELRRIPEERVSAVVGVPAGVAGLGAGLDRNTFTNYGDANRAAFTQGILPLQRGIAADLERQLLEEFVDLDEGYDLDFDVSKVSAMADALDAVWRRNTEAATKGLQTRAAWKRAVGQEVAKDGSDDVYIAPSNYVATPAGKATPDSFVWRPPVDALTDTEPLAIAAREANGNGRHPEPTGVPA